MSTQVVRHTSRGVDITLNFASTENNLSWSFTQEGDGEIYDVELVNVASYTIKGGAVTLPYAVTNGTSYAVSIVKTATGQTASITFKTRRATVKTTSINVPDFGQYNGRYLFISSGLNLYKLDTNLLKSDNYAGGGVWSTTPIINTYTFPDISSELNYSGVAGTIYWRSICFIVNNSIPYVFCYASDNATNDEICSLFRIDNETFYKLNLTDTGYTRTAVGYGASGVAGGISYNYITGDVVVRRTRAAGAHIVRFDSSFNRSVFGFGSMPDKIFHGSASGGGSSGSNRKHNIDPTTSEFCTHLSRISIPSEANRNYMDSSNSDSKYIRANGYVITNNGTILSQRRCYNANGSLVVSLSGSGTATGNAGAICASESNNWIFGCSSSSVGVWRHSINVNNDGYNYNMTIGTADHNGFRGCINSDYSGLAFAWGLATRNSGKRLYVFNPSKLDASIEVGYLDFATEINDMYTNQYI